MESIDICSQIRRSTEKQRPFVLIPKEEIAGAIVDILRNTLSISRNSLVVDIAREIYHNKKTGRKIKEKIDEAVDYLIKQKLAEEVNGRIRLIKSNCKKENG